MRRAILLALLVVFVAVGASAQTLTGTITGKITDEQGGVLPGVTVTLTGRTGSVVQVTDAKGEYRFIGLTPGTYNIKSELQSFRPKEQQGIDVGMSKTIEVNLTMGVGALSENVDVVANAVTIDTTTTATDTNMSQDLLFSMPMTHNNPAVNLLQYTPGVTDGSAFGGAATSGNALMLDGVDTRDPEGGTAWTFYNYNIIDEVQVGSLGQQAEYGGFTGAMVNTITKSGGNRFASLSEMRYTNDSSWLFANNTDPAITALNKNLGRPARVLGMKDYTVQLSGPIKKDKIFFFASIQRYQIEQQPSGPIRSEVSPRFNFKFTFQPTVNDNIVASLQVDQYNQKGRTGLVPGYAVTSQSQTIDQDSPEAIYNLQYRRVFNPSTLFEAKFTGYWGYYDLNPVSTASFHYDNGTSTYCGSYIPTSVGCGAGYVAQYDRTRNQLNMALTKHAQMAGSHDFKFGVEIERSSIRDRFQYSGKGVNFQDYYGMPSYAYSYTYDLKGKNKRESYYAQDSWKLNRRLTATLGLRADHIVGADDTIGKDLYKTTSFGPRLGVVFDLTGKGTSVVRAYYGQLYDSAVFSSYSKAVTGLTDLIFYDVGPNWSTLKEYDRVPATLKYKVADNIKHPRVDEVSFSYEQQFLKSFKFTATGIVRDWHNFVNAVLDNAQWTSGSYAMPAWTGTGPNPVSATAINYYKWANPSVGQHFTIQNVDNVTYQIDGKAVTAEANRRYRGLMLILERAYKNRWQANFSWTISKTEGTVSNSQSAGVSSGQYETPNGALINADGPTSYDRRHMIKVFAGYQIPKIEVSVNGYFQYGSGYPYSAFARVTGSRLAWSTYNNISIDNRSLHKTEAYSQADVRLEKVFSVGFHRFGVYVDISNVFNQNTVLSNNGRYPNVGLTDASGKSFSVDFGGPLTMMTGRQATLGARWSF